MAGETPKPSVSISLKTISQCRQQLILAVRTYGTDNPAVAASMVELAQQYEAQMFSDSNHVKSEELYKQALVIYENSSKTLSISYLTEIRKIKISLARIFASQKRPEEAEELYLEILNNSKTDSLQGFDDIFDDEPGNLLQTEEEQLIHLALGDIYSTLGKFTNSKEYYINAINIQKTLISDQAVIDFTVDSITVDSNTVDSASVDDKELLQSVNLLHLPMYKVQLIQFYHYQKKFKKIEELLKVEVIEAEKNIRNNYQNLLTTIVNLADYHFATDSKNKAEFFYKKAVELSSNRGCSSKRQYLCLAKLRQFYDSENNTLESKRALITAITKIELANRHHYALIPLLQCLSDYYALSHVNKTDRAEALSQRALSIAEKTFGTSHLEVAFCLEHLGMFYVKEQENKDQRNLFRYGNNSGQGYLEALKVYKRAVMIFDKKFGPANLEIGGEYGLLGQLANVCKKLQLFDEASILEKRIVLNSSMSLAEDSLKSGNRKIIDNSDKSNRGSSSDDIVDWGDIDDWDGLDGDLDIDNVTGSELDIDSDLGLGSNSDIDRDLGLGSDSDIDRDLGLGSDSDIDRALGLGSDSEPETSSSTLKWLEKFVVINNPQSKFRLTKEELENHFVRFFNKLSVKNPMALNSTISLQEYR